jgi:glycine/betaine/sarcosine/D-proline reductase family selenoprotein B
MRAVHFLNQFFAGIGGEKAAKQSPLRLDGAVGPGRKLDMEISATVVCGDDYFGERESQALGQLLQWIEDAKSDVLICGPAFAAGRYGYACGVLAREAVRRGTPAVCAMHEDNPGVLASDGAAYIVPTGESVSGMRDVLAKMSDLARAVVEGRAESAPPGTYLARGRRTNVFVERSGADRAIEMTLAKIAGEPYEAEVRPPSDRVPVPGALERVANVRLALVTEAGVVPTDNPDRLEQCRAKGWHSYDISGLDSLEAGRFESVHGGFDVHVANRDPNRLVPLDAVRALQREGRIGRVEDFLYSTTGNCTPAARSLKFGQEIAQRLTEIGVAAALVTGT